MSYFTRVSQIEEQLEAMGEDIENGEVVMTTLNGLPSSWDSYIEGICARIKLSLSVGRGRNAHKKKLES